MNEYEIKMVKAFEEKHNRKPEGAERLYIEHLAHKLQNVVDDIKFNFDWFLKTGDTTE